MSDIHDVSDPRSAAELASRLNGSARRRPIVVVTTPPARTQPWIDVDRVAREAGDLAEVYLMATGAASREFARRMVEGTQVYGGAGRVYPVGHEWKTDLTRSPLRFAYAAHEGKRATDSLISDLLRMAFSAGLTQSTPATTLRHAAGRVTGIVSGRAFVDVGAAMPASIAEELTVADVSIDRIVSVGQQVEGLFDPETGRLDVTRGLRPCHEALAHYAVGDVVLAKVGAVSGDTAGLMLYPTTRTKAVVVGVAREDVTTNPADDLRSLMTPGEVVEARVVSTAPRWSLTLSDINDDEQPVPAPSLLPGGPPWMTTEDVDDTEQDQQDLEPSGQLLATPEDRPLPTPALLTAKRGEAAPGNEAPDTPNGPDAEQQDIPASDQDTEPLNAQVPASEVMKARLSACDRARRMLEQRVDDLTDETDQLRFLLDQAERRARNAENSLKAARTKLRKKSAKTTGQAPAPRFADREQGFRYLVLTAWATRTEPGEQAEHPLPDYLLGDDFLDSLDHLEGISEAKVADVVFEVLTGLAAQMPSRELHRLRTGNGGDDPARIRDDGAVAWRASLQVKTPSARRLHFWVLPDGTNEFAKVGVHDDLTA
jgi:exosome complex RNA-binding protein Csl4